jgi:hypothetical protein
VSRPCSRRLSVEDETQRHRLNGARLGEPSGQRPINRITRQFGQWAHGLGTSAPIIPFGTRNPLEGHGQTQRLYVSSKRGCKAGVYSGLRHTRSHDCNWDPVAWRILISTGFAIRGPSSRAPCPTPARASSTHSNRHTSKNIVLGSPPCSCYVRTFFPRAICHLPNPDSLGK